MTLPVLRAISISLVLAVPALAAPPAKPGAAPASVGLDAPSERLAASVLGSYKTGVSRQQVRSAAKTLVEVSAKNGIDPWIVLGVIRVESSGWSHARSDAGARGLMQVMPFVGKAMAKETGLRWTGPESLHDPQVNLTLGVHYLATLVDRYEGDVDRALAAYSMGPSKMERIVARGKRPVDDYEITVRWFASRYRALAREHGDLEPGLSRFELALKDLEREVGGRPRQAYVLATGKQPPKPKTKPAAAVAKAPEKKAPAKPKLEINRATVADLLLAHPSVTPRAAKAIVAYRDANGPFVTLDALDRVPGLDRRIAAALRGTVVASLPADGSTLVATAE